MKYIRKAIVLILAAVFIAAVAIGLSVIFAVRNINVFRIDYQRADGAPSEEFERALSSVQYSLSEFEGKAIAGVDEEDIAEAVNASGYAEFVSCEKIYPCTINVTVRERVEIFAVPSEDGLTWSVLDRDCRFISSKRSNANNLDGSPNVLLENIPEEDYQTVAGLAELFEEKFSSVRAFAESITMVPAALQVETDSLCIKLRCGLTLEIRDYKNSPLEKAEALCTAFESMPDYLKLSGSMYCMASAGGALRGVLPDGSVV